MHEKTYSSGLIMLGLVDGNPANGKGLELYDR